ncbi:MAG: type II toxin-antitoxin system RelE/ParE family toxin [Phycisphaerales bacterium]|nr:type II toxin-antitoxin system RelE/ParE family toxin [Phycisphaerales bacterium]
MAKRHTKESAELVYWRGLVNPEDWLRFVELSPFARRRKELEFTDAHVRAIQYCIMLGPAMNPVIPGTGGVRKMRFSAPGSNRGKSGSYRVLYTYFPNSGIIALITAYAKGEQDNINAEDKKTFRQLVETIEHGLSKGTIR